MLKEPQKDTRSDNLGSDGEVSVQEEATKDKQETSILQGDLSLTEKKKNIDLWRKGMLKRVKNEKVAVLGRRQ